MKYFKRLINEGEILEELYLAGILEYVTDNTSKNIYTPYKYECKISGWNLRRADHFWSASFNGNGLPLKYALMLYERKNPINDDILGKIIRAGGSCGSPILTAQPIYNEDLYSQFELLGYRKEYSDFLELEHYNISQGKVAELCNDGKLNVERYINLYHIDNQIGLNEFVKFINFYIKNS
jgi:hypothetical protein